MSADDTRYAENGEPTEARGSYGSGAARIALWILLIAALGFFLPFAFIVDGGILSAVSR